MKKLFDENERFTEEAMKISHELETAIGKIFKKYHKQGYLLRELGYLGFVAINLMEAELILSKGLKKAIGRAGELD